MIVKLAFDNIKIKHFLYLVLDTWISIGAGASSGISHSELFIFSPFLWFSQNLTDVLARALCLWQVSLVATVFSWLMASVHMEHSSPSSAIELTRTNLDKTNMYSKICLQRSQPFINQIKWMRQESFDIVRIKLAFWLILRPLMGKVSVTKFSLLYYLSLVISWKEKLAFDHCWS